MNGKRLLRGVLLLGLLLYPFGVTNLYFLHLAILIGIYALLAISVNLLFGYAGQLSLGHAAFFGVGAYTSALMYLNLGVPMWGGMVGALAASGVLGYIIGRLSLKLRGAYFVIMTIGVAEVLKLVALNWTDLTRGPMGLTDIAAPVVALGFVGPVDFAERRPFYYLVAVSVVLGIALQGRIVHSFLGRSFVAIRENEDLAESIGVNCYKYLVIVVAISAGLAGLAGALYAHYVSFIDPGVFAFFLSVNLVMMVIGGGQGTVMGPIVGAVLFTFVPEFLRVFGDSRMAIYALLVIAVVIFMPKGIVYYLTRLFRLGVRSR